MMPGSESDLEPVSCVALSPDGALVDSSVGFSWHPASIIAASARGAKNV
jgi:hypothetical protein